MQQRLIFDVPEISSLYAYNIRLCKRQEIKDFVELHHYSHSINGVLSTFCFALENDTDIEGAMIYGGLAMHDTWKKYVSSEEKIIELRRLCCIDKTPQNTESYFIARTLKWLIQNTDIEKVVSYADPNFGHAGTIYKASNFQYLGTTQPGKVILFDGKRYHDKSIRTKYNGKLKPFAEKIKLALENGTAHYIDTKPKHVYLYDLQSRRRQHIKGCMKPSAEPK